MFGLLIAASVGWPSERVFLNTGMLASGQSLRVEVVGAGRDTVATKMLSTQDYFQAQDAFCSGVSFNARGVAQLRISFVSPQAASVLPIIVSKRTLLTTTYSVYDDEAMLSRGPPVEGVTSATAGADTALQVDLTKSTPTTVQRYSFDALFLALFMALAVPVLQGFCRLAKHQHAAVVVGFLCVMAVVAGMAWTLPHNHGPDEWMHFPSYYWYIDHLRPPSLFAGDATYANPIWQSNYVLGASGDLGYLLTAKLHNLLAWLLPGVDALFVFRLSQLALVFAGLGLGARFFATPVALAYMLCWVIIPQLAYTATYLNGDSLSFVMGFLALALFLDERSKPVHWLLAVFLLVNAKANYLAILALLPLVWWIRRHDISLSPRHVLLFVAAFPLWFYRRIFNFVDQYLAGTNYVAAAHQRLLETTDVQVVPFSIVDASYQRVLKGVSAYDWSPIFTPAWYESSLHSFFGVFGYMSFPISLALLAVPMAAFAWICVVAVVDKKRNWILVGAGVVLAFCASLYYSVSEGYQAQGRYLFPIICVVALLARNRLERHAVPLVLAALPTLFALTMFTAKSI
ncbi:hypothetical protein H0A65_17150 [Alcaligenaceae bacterium]|nr:hypothetical protein [Alcaligenaceae bacterium]